jgi:hypothetical protein
MWASGRAELGFGTHACPAKTAGGQRIEAGNILIKDSAVLPKELQIESEPCMPGWSLVKDFDGHGLDRAVRQAGWTFFRLAGEIRTIVLGIDERSMIRRAIKQIVTNPRSKKFNSLEIIRVASKRFLGVPYVSVNAQSRHIQESLFLLSAGRVPEWGRTKLTATRTMAWDLTSAKGLASEGTNGRVGVVATPSP